jgi:hypothetical protein
VTLYTSTSYVVTLLPTTLAATTSQASGYISSDTGTVTFCFYGTASNQTVTFVAVQSDPQGYLAMQPNPFVHTVPSSYTNWGQTMACSNDGTVLLVGASNYLTLWNLTNPKDAFAQWRWASQGQIEVDGLISVAVSPDGQILAWCRQGQNQLYVGAEFDGVAGFHHTQIVAWPSAPTAGGLSISQVDTAKYAVLSASGNGTVLYATVDYPVT